ncbi:MAG: hypothetical protein MUP26_06440 [Desulfobulbaceae bacterium]|nr:hypothetical protein [Desulfobulbaceae bacterium]
MLSIVQPIPAPVNIEETPLLLNTNQCPAETEVKIAIAHKNDFFAGALPSVVKKDQ